jgi:hypothetical protein
MCIGSFMKPYKEQAGGKWDVYDLTGGTMGQAAARSATFASFDAAHPRKLALYTEFQKRKGKDKSLLILRFTN